MEKLWFTGWRTPGKSELSLINRKSFSRWQSLVSLTFSRSVPKCWPWCPLFSSWGLVWGSTKKPSSDWKREGEQSAGRGGRRKGRERVLCGRKGGEGGVRSQEAQRERKQTSSTFLPGRGPIRAPSNPDLINTSPIQFSDLSFLHWSTGKSFRTVGSCSCAYLVSRLGPSPSSLCVVSGPSSSP